MNDNSSLLSFGTTPSIDRGVNVRPTAPNELKLESDGGNLSGFKTPPLLTRILFQLHQGLFGLLFALQKKSDSQGSQFWFYLREFFELLQFLSFPFRSRANFPWNASHTAWFLVFVNGTVPEHLVSGNVVFYSVIVCLALVLLNAGVVGYFFSQGQYRFVWTRKAFARRSYNIVVRYLRFVCTLFITILYIPVLGLFMSMLHDCGDPDDTLNSTHALDAASCWTDLFAVRSTAVLIVGVIYAGLSLTFCLSVFEQDPADKSELLNRPHSRIELYQLFMKTLLSVTFGILEAHVEFRWLLVCLCLFASISTLFLYIWFSPNYNWRYNMIRIQVYAVFTWASICLAIVVLIDDPTHNSVSLMFYIVFPGTILIASYVANLRKSWLKKCQVTQTTSAFAVELKARFLLEDAGMLLNRGAIDASPEQKAAEHKVLAEINELYAHAVEVIPNSSILYMFWSIFSLYNCQNKQRSLVLLSECEKRRPMIDEKFVVFRQRKVMNDAESTENTDMLEYIICESYIRKAAKHEHKAVSLQLRFWTELCERNVDLKKLLNLGTRINAEVSIADTNYRKALKSNPKSLNVLSSYSKFLLDVCNDVQRSEELAEKAHNIEDLKRRSQTMSGGVMDATQLMSDVSSDLDTALFTISHTGAIISANSGVTAVLGYDKPLALIGQNISALVPNPLAKMHDMFLSKYMERGEGSIIAKVRKVFAVKEDGYIVPVLLLVRQLTYGTSATFLGIFKPVPEGASTYAYIVLDESGFIRGMTDKCTKYFGYTPADVARYQMHITQFIENFEAVSELLNNSTAGYKMQIETDGSVLELCGTMITLCMGGTTLRVVKFVDANDKIFKSASHSSDFDMTAGMPMKYNSQENLVKLQSVAAVNSKEQMKEEHKLAVAEEPSKLKVEHGRSMPSKKDTASMSSHRIPGAEARNLVKTESTASQQGPAFERQSMRSGGSKSSKTMQSFMRSVFNKRIEFSSSMLARLQGVLVFMFAIIGALAIFTNVYVYSSYMSFDARFDAILSTGNNLVNSAAVVDKLTALNANRATMDVSARTQASQAIIQIAANISQTHYNLYNQSRPLVAAMFTQPSLSYVSDIANNIVLENLSLNDVINTFVSQSAQMALNLVDLGQTFDLSEISSLLIDTMEEPLQNLLFFFLDDFAALTSSMAYSVYMICIVSIFVVDALVMVLLLVIFLRTKAETSLVYKLFLDLPKDAILTMHASCIQKLNSMDISKGTEGALTDDKAGKLTEGMFDIEHFIKKNNGQRASLKHDSKKKHREEVTNFKKLLFRYAILFFVTTGYFCFFPVYADFFLRKYNSAGIYLAWATRTWYAVSDLFYVSSSLYSDTAQISSENTDWESKLADVATSMQDLVSYKDGLLYGDDLYHMRYFLAELGVYGTAILPLTMDSYPTFFAFSDKCRKVQSGVMNHGIYNSLAQYVELTRDVIAAVKSLNDTTSHGKDLLMNYQPFQILDVMAHECLPQYFNAFVSQVYKGPKEEAFVVNNYAHITSTVLLLVFIAMFYKFSIAVLLTHLRHEIELTPTMLLMIPPQVLMKVDSIRAYATLDKKL